MNTRQILNEYCQKYIIGLPEYYHEFTGQTITSVYAHFNGEKYAINPCHFNTKKEANEQVAKLILNKLNGTRSTPMQKLEPKDLVFCIDNEAREKNMKKINQLYYIPIALINLLKIY